MTFTCKYRGRGTKNDTNDAKQVHHLRNQFKVQIAERTSSNKRVKQPETKSGIKEMKRKFRLHCVCITYFIEFHILHVRTYIIL